MPDILIADEGPVRTVRINRPEKKNALTLSMYDAMAEAIENPGTDIRCLIIAGHESAFCAGNDLNDFIAMAKSGGLGAPIIRFLYALVRSDIPVVAAVNGAAVGVGTTMLLHCDQVIAGETASFATPFVALGLVPEAASSLIAPRLMGHARAFSLLVMGKKLSADDAKDAGIVNTIVPAATVDAKALTVARAIAALPAEGVRAARHLMRGAPDAILVRIDEEAAAFRERLASAEAQAAFAAFFERKR